ncbi:unnamed protein product [Ixodes persulcatus]
MHVFTQLVPENWQGIHINGRHDSSSLLTNLPKTNLFEKRTVSNNHLREMPSRVESYTNSAMVKQ